MNADDGQSRGFVFVVPAPQLRDDVFAIDSAIGPEFHKDDSAFKARDGQRFAVDPINAGDIRRRRAAGERRAGARPCQPNR